MLNYVIPLAIPNKVCTFATEIRNSSDNNLKEFTIMTKNQFNDYNRELNRLMLGFTPTQRFFGIDMNLPTQRGMLISVRYAKGDIRFVYKSHNITNSFSWNETDLTTIRQVINKLKSIK